MRGGGGGGGRMTSVGIERSVSRIPASFAEHNLTDDKDCTLPRPDIGGGVVGVGAQSLAYATERDIDTTRVVVLNEARVHVPSYARSSSNRRQ